MAPQARAVPPRRLPGRGRTWEACYVESTLVWVALRPGPTTNCTMPEKRVPARLGFLTKAFARNNEGLWWQGALTVPEEQLVPNFGSCPFYCDMLVIPGNFACLRRCRNSDTQPSGSRSSKASLMHSLFSSVRHVGHGQSSVKHAVWTLDFTS